MGRPPTGKPTSFDIAYLAGVSQPTVSRALRGDRSVSEATRQKIAQIAADLRYTVDKNASSLRSQRSNTLALLFFEDDPSEEGTINPFFLAMLGSITRACANRGLDLLISFQRMEDNWHTRYQDAHRADGLILLGYGDYSIYSTRLAQLIEQGTHFTRWGSVRSEGSGATIGSDNLGAGQLAGEHLIAQGCRRIAFLGHASQSYPEFAHRYEGLCMAMRAAGLAADPALQHDAYTIEEDGYRAAQALIAGGRSFDAIFAASDLIAVGAMRALAEAGLSVPGDVAVIGFDNIPAASLTSPPLTTIQQDMKGAGDRLVETLLAQIEGRDLPDARLPTRLVTRGSTARS
jgi:DNA-binding LacI/PurR family transcriptional regulator